MNSNIYKIFRLFLGEAYHYDRNVYLNSKKAVNQTSALLNFIL